MDQIDKNRFFEMPEIFDNLAQFMVPQYDFLQDEIFRIISFENDKPISIIDLGGGSGIWLEKFLKRYKNAQVFWVDYSKAFLDIAGKRLDKFSDRVKYILSKFEDNWESEIKVNPDIIVSMSSIHHLETQEKKRLYKRIYDILNPGGWFFNIDEMKTLYQDSYLQSMEFWGRYSAEAGNSLSEEKQIFLPSWNKHFENWKLRNIKQSGSTKQKGDDIHDPFLDQLEWLHEIGFNNADLFMKYHLWSVIGGRK